MSELESEVTGDVAEPASNAADAVVDPPSDPSPHLLGGTPAPVEPIPYSLDALKVPEGFALEEEHKTFLNEYAEKYGMSGDAMQALVDRYASDMKSASDRVSTSAQAAWNEVFEKDTAETKAHYGANLDTVLKSGVRVIDEFGSKEVTDLLKATGLSNNLHVIKMFEKLAGALGEGKPAQPNATPKAVNDFDAMYPSTADMAKKDAR